MMIDNYDLLQKHDAEQERWINARPVCNCCQERIQDESYHKIFGENICDSCLDGMVVYADD